MTTKPKYWAGSPGDKDDFGQPITDEFVDGNTIYRHWAIMSPATFAAIGQDIAPGIGQRYRKQPDGRWLKVGG